MKDHLKDYKAIHILVYCIADIKKIRSHLHCLKKKGERENMRQVLLTSPFFLPSVTGVESLLLCAVTATNTCLASVSLMQQVTNTEPRGLGAHTRKQLRSQTHKRRRRNKKKRKRRTHQYCSALIHLSNLI